MARGLKSRPNREHGAEVEILAHMSIGDGSEQPAKEGGSESTVELSLEDICLFAGAYHQAMLY